ncbi:MAG: hypothetical protein RMA76_03240 [Deltaproteobacteria bacterium]|jgi:tetratricopeptide (TPR) repeat protein
MASLQELLRDLDRALKANQDPIPTRLAIAEAFPETPEGARARYELGLTALYLQQLDRAEVHLRAAAKAKQKTWSHLARTSLGLVLLTQGKHQQAVFELRRAASAQPPNLMVAQAAGLLHGAFVQIGNAKEATKARAQHLAILDGLTKHEDAATAALAKYLRGMEHKFDGERAPAKTLLAAALEGDRLPPDERSSAERALSAL